MRMDVDEAGCHQQSPSVDFAPSTADVAADRSDEFTVDGEVGDAARRAGAIDERAVANHEIVHEGPPVFLLWNDASAAVPVRSYSPSFASAQPGILFIPEK
jgi:hypothetical protein